MDKRPLSQSVRQWLLDEIELWRGQGLVTEDQANAILDLYESPRPACKILAHNLCVLTQEQCELGIEPIFWQNEERETNVNSMVLQMSSA